MMNTATHDVLALRRRLSARLRPLALAIGVLVSLGLPLTYYALQYTALGRDAAMSAARLAARLPGADTAGVVREFASGHDVVSVRVLYTRPGSRPTIAIVTPLAARWWNAHVPVGTATISVAGEPLGTVEVSLSQGRLVVITLGLFIMSTLVALVLGILVYAVPVRVVGGMESRVATLVTEQARLYAEATRREREAGELARIARVLNETLDVAGVGDRIVESVLPLFEGRSSGLYALEPDGSLRAIAWGGDARERYALGQRFAAGDGVIGWVVAHSAPVANADVVSDPRFVFSDARRAELAEGGNTAVLAVPLHAKGTMIGVLAVADKSGRRFSADEVALLQAFADQAALAFENARLYQRAQQAYAELTAAQDRLVRGETLRAMGELASGAAHHLNNLLAVILGRVQLAKSKAPPPEVARHLAMAERATLDGADVVRRMRGFAQAQSEPDLILVDLNRVAAEVLELTRPRWGDEAHMRGITIETRLEEGDIPSVRGAMGPLREVLVNLVLNAIDALPEGGRIKIRTWADTGWVHCSVTDTGVGMSAEVRRRALEPFYTTKGVKSTGLGLSVNYGILQRLGGDMVVESEEGRGTTILIKLPVAEARAAEPEPPLELPLRALCILVIDDEPEVRMMLADLLTDDGHHVIEAASGAEGLQHLENQRPVDVVLSDLGMPGMTGWEVARAVKARRADLPVVLITGWGETPEQSPDDRGSADLVLAKPVTSLSLRSALARVVASS